MRPSAIESVVCTSTPRLSEARSRALVNMFSLLTTTAMRSRTPVSSEITFAIASRSSTATRVVTLSHGREAAANGNGWPQ